VDKTVLLDQKVTLVKLGQKVTLDLQVQPADQDPQFMFNNVLLTAVTVLLVIFGINTNHGN
jgi:hypothetical protein